MFLFTFPSGVLSHSFALPYVGFCTMWPPAAKWLLWQYFSLFQKSFKWQISSRQYVIPSNTVLSQPTVIKNTQKVEKLMRRVARYATVKTLARSLAAFHWCLNLLKCQAFAQPCTVYTFHNIENNTWIPFVRTEQFNTGYNFPFQNKLEQAFDIHTLAVLTRKKLNVTKPTTTDSGKCCILLMFCDYGSIKL